MNFVSLKNSLVLARSEYRAETKLRFDFSFFVFFILFGVSFQFQPY